MDTGRLHEQASIEGLRWSLRYGLAMGALQIYQNSKAKSSLVDVDFCVSLGVEMSRKGGGALYEVRGAVLQCSYLGWQKYRN